MGDADFQISGNQVSSSSSPDVEGANRTIEVTTGYTPDFGLLPGSGMSSFGTSGVIVTLNALDPSGTVYAEISNWGGTYAKTGTTPSYSEISTWVGTTYGEVSNWMGTAGGGSPLGLLPGSTITLSTSGEVVSIVGIDPSGTIFGEVSNWMGTVAGGATDYAEISNWGGTYAKSGTTPSYSEISTWNGTVYSDISTWQGTLANDWGIQGDTYITASTAGDVVSLSSQPVFTQVSTWMGTAGGGVSNRVLIATGTASNSASIEFTGADIPNYRRLYIVGDSITPQTADRPLTMLTSSNAGGTYWGENVYESNGWYMASSIVIGRVNDYWALLNTGAYSDINTTGASFYAIVNPYVVGTSNPSFYSTGFVPLGGYANITSAQGFMLPRANITAFKIQYTTGNINQGVFHLYGEH